MSYTVAGCCYTADRGGGLGAVAPPVQIERELQILNDMVRDLHAKAKAAAAIDPRLVGFVEDAARYWAEANDALYFQGLPDRARTLIVQGLTRAQQIAPAVNSAFAQVRQIPQGARAEAEARAGSSIATQVQRTLGGSSYAVTEPIAQALQTVSPAAAEAVRSSGWLFPILGGLAAFLVLRR